MSVTRPISVITLEGAKRLAAAAEAEAISRKWTVAIAIVDMQGGLILFHILDGTQAASQKIAIVKARTAATFRRPTKLLEDSVANRPGLGTVNGTVMLEGGLPIVIDGQMVGAIGVSGMASSEDGIIAAAALAAL